ncbi:MAG TPA: pyroglutamyl-peptidase I [Stellaceae bacterium]|nr:pyroglutamyl-peptidase I [Stellaceae bacterium]
MKILVTGFEPFAGESVNPAQQAAEQFAAPVDGFTVATRILPVAFDRALAVLEAALVETAPAIVLCLGEAGGRAELSLERVAINLDDARIPDNDGRQPVDRPIAAAGPAAYFTTLPVKAALAALREAGLPAALSHSAGTFVCNHVFYGLLHLAATRRLPLLGGFLHLPYLPEQAARHPGLPSMALPDIVRGVAVVLRTAARHAEIA